MYLNNQNKLSILDQLKNFALANPIITNVATFVGIVAGGVIIIKTFFPSDKGTFENGSKPLNEANSTVESKQNEATVEANVTVTSTVDQPLVPTVDEPYTTVEYEEDSESTTDEIEEYTIRQAMSALGKRSAEKRRLNRLNIE